MRMVIDDVDPAAYSLLVIPGDFPVATICHDRWLLVSADVVRGRHRASYWHDAVPEEVVATGGSWEDEPVVVDGNLVSSRWPADLPAFTAAMMRLVRGDAAG